MLLLLAVVLVQRGNHDLTLGRVHHSATLFHLLACSVIIFGWTQRKLLHLLIRTFLGRLLLNHVKVAASGLLGSVNFSQIVTHLDLLSILNDLLFQRLTISFKIILRLLLKGARLLQLLHRRLRTLKLI